MNPVMYEFGNIQIRWYSVFILAGVIIGILLAMFRGKRKGLDPGEIFDLGFYTVFFGIIGARIYYCLFNYSIYKDNPLNMLKVWNGGLAIHGGIIVGLIVIILFAKSKKIPILTLTDIVAPSLILAQAIGRWGNFFNSEAHGPATSYAFLKSLKIIPHFVIKGMKIEGIYYHPTFYYESIWCIAGFLLIMVILLLFRKIKKGEITCIYLIWYSIGRYYIESLRTDSLMIGKYKIAQLISLSIIVVASLIYLYIKIFTKEEIKEEKNKETKKEEKKAKKEKKKEEKKENKKEKKKKKEKTTEVKEETKKEENSEKK